MKKKIIFLLLFIMSMTACSSVSQEDYNSKTKELENMKTELANIQTELSNTQKEYADYKKQIVEEEMAKSGAKGWATTAFGEHAQAIVYDNDLYVNIPTGYTISEKSIKDLWNTILSGVRLYSVYYLTNPEQLPYNCITIIAQDEETGLDILSAQFLKNSDNTFTQNTIMISINEFDTIISSLK